MTTDVLIRGGLLFDGSGSPPRIADVRIEAGRVMAVGDADGSASRIVDAAGQYVAPGFIDMHTHSDITLIANPEVRHSVAQGVTTEVVGNCGFSAAPVPAGHFEEVARYIEGFGARPESAWSFDEYLDKLSARGVGVNVVPLAGHGVLRVGVLGTQTWGTGAETDRLAAVLEDCLDAGAWGLSFGLAYPPGVFAERTELRRLAKAVARRGALLAVHLRSEGAHLLDSLDEVLTLAAEEQLRLQISHLKVVGARNAGLISRALERIAEARARGLDVHSDVYPYTAGSTYLTQLLPPELHRAGSPAMLNELRRGPVRDALKRSLAPGAAGWTDLGQTYGGWAGVVIIRASAPSLRELEGKSLREIADRLGVDEVDALCDIVVKDEARTLAIFFLMAERDVETVWADAHVAVGSDSLAVVNSEERVHPRAYGTFVKLLARAAREDGVMSVTEVIRRMTSLPARILGLHDRGVVGPGAAADLVVFDPKSVRDVATYDQPTRYAAGVRHVFVNGDPVVDDGVIVGSRPGHVLRRRSS